MLADREERLERNCRAWQLGVIPTKGSKDPVKMTLTGKATGYGDIN